MVESQLSPAFLEQLEPSAPEHVWSWDWSWHGEVKTLIVDEAGKSAWNDTTDKAYYACISTSPAGITSVAKRYKFEYQIGLPVCSSFPADFTVEDYDGFILYDDNGKEIKRWLIR